MTAAAPDRRIAVLHPLPLEGPYDYLAPRGLADLAPGAFVRVPLGRRSVVGVVWDEAEGTLPAAKLKPVEARLDIAPLEAEMRRFVEWVAAYTLAPRGAVLKMTMSVREVFDPPRPQTAYRLSGPPPSRLTPARARVIDVARGTPPLPMADLARLAGVTTGVVAGLRDAGTLEAVALAAGLPLAAPDPMRPGPVLSPAQDAAASALKAAVRGCRYETTLLEGVTGSGKTEVYFEAIAEALARGRQVLVLLPEIALTHQWLDRFEARFGARPAEWHSDLGQAVRRRTWTAVAGGQTRVVVGARSALFLPFSALGLIVVDEEHDPGFKQEEGVAYHARDMAVVRASIGRFPIVLASATPSLETATNAQDGRYARLHLPERHGGAVMPRIEAVDLRLEAPERGRWLSPRLVAALAETVEAGEQAMLFLNRRGYAPLTLCRACGHRFECPDCAAWLVSHRARHRLLCHHCGFGLDAPDCCPACGAEEALAACGPGVERLAEEVAARMPALRIGIATSDTLAGPRAAGAFFGRVAAQEINLVIGTQIIAKGHHFPLVTLVGVVDADLGLQGGDLRAAERTFQLLSQVAGRAGREERPGRVLIQSYMPEHPVMEALVSGDAGTFFAREAEARRAARMPPFGRLAALILSGADAALVEKTARALGRQAPNAPEAHVLGPAPAPLALLRGRHRWRFLVKADRRVNLSRLVRDWLARAEIPGRVRLQVDIDPVSFL